MLFNRLVATIHDTMLFNHWARDGNGSPALPSFARQQAKSLVIYWRMQTLMVSLLYTHYTVQSTFTSLVIRWSRKLAHCSFQAGDMKTSPIADLFLKLWYWECDLPPRVDWWPHFWSHFHILDRWSWLMGGPESSVIAQMDQIVEQIKTKAALECAGV